MPETIELIRDQPRYVVKMDVDGNGVADEVVFQDMLTANLLEDCFVNKSDETVCKQWMEQLKTSSSLPSVDYVQLYTKTGHKACKEKTMGSYLLERNNETGDIETYKAMFDCVIDDHKSDDGLPLMFTTDSIYEKDGIKCAKGSFVELDKDGKLKRAELASDQIVSGYKLPKGTIITFGYDDKLQTAEMPTNAKINGYPILKNTELTFSDNKLSSAYIYSRLRTNGTTFAANTEIRFGSDGSFYEGTIKGDQVISGYFVPDGSTVNFYDGELLSITFSKTAYIDGKTLIPKNVEISVLDNLKYSMKIAGFDMESTDKRVDVSSEYSHDLELPEDRIIYGMRLHTGDKLSFDNETSRLSSAVLSSATTIAGFELKAGDIVGFDENGVLRTMRLANDNNTIFGLSLKKDDHMTFSEKGTIWWVKVETNNTIQGQEVLAGDYITFDDNMRISNIWVMSDRTIQGIEFRKKDRVYFNNDGKVIPPKE